MQGQLRQSPKRAFCPAVGNASHRLPNLYLHTHQESLSRVQRVLDLNSFLLRLYLFGECWLFVFRVDGTARISCCEKAEVFAVVYSIRNLHVLTTPPLLHGVDKHDVVIQEGTHLPFVLLLKVHFD